MGVSTQAPDDYAWLIGKIFNERYRTARLVGSGANGAVCEAEDFRISTRRVAIKVAPAGSSESEFKREAELVCSLSNDYIVKATDYGVQDGYSFIVMDLLDGESLYNVLRRMVGRRLPMEMVTQFVREIGNALTHAHANGVIHRDLKPNNVMSVVKGRDGDGNPEYKFVLLDFGIASNIDATSSMRNETMDGLGTPEYRSPEQIHGIDVTESTDIYTFGVVLYEVLTGRVPFPGKGISLEYLETVILTEPPPRFSEVAPDLCVDPRIEELVLRCLEKDPARRPSSINEIRQRYLEIVEPSPVKRPVYGALAAALAIVLAMAVAIVWFLQKPPVWIPKNFEPRGNDQDYVTLGKHRYAPQLVRTGTDLPSDQEVVFVLVRRPEGMDRQGDYFYILRDKVWYALYRKFVDAEVALRPAHESCLHPVNGECVLTKKEAQHPFELREKDFGTEVDATKSDGNDERERWPVTNVSVNAAYYFSQWLVPPDDLCKEGGTLPTLEEWWAAAGWHPGVDHTKGPFRGDGTRVASNRDQPVPVGASEDDTAVKPFGCNDMAGNGYEWTASQNPATEDVRHVSLAPKLTFPTHENAVYVGGSFQHEPARFSDYKGTDIWPSWGNPRKDVGFRVVFRLP